MGSSLTLLICLDVREFQVRILVIDLDSCAFRGKEHPEIAFLDIDLPIPCERRFARRSSSYGGRRKK